MRSRLIVTLGLLALLPSAAFAHPASGIAADGTSSILAAITR